jgi:predicted DNA-binding ArsR family transcriptional regulator
MGITDLRLNFAGQDISAAKTLELMEKHLVELEKKTKKVGKIAQETSKKVDTSFKKTSKTAQETTNKIDTSFKKMFGGFTRMSSKFNNTAKATSKKVEINFKNMSDGFTRMSSKISRGLTEMVGKTTMLLGVGGFVGIVTKSIGAMKEFEKAIAEVSTLFKGDASKSIAIYEKQIREMAKNSSRSIADLTKGLYQVISASVKGGTSVQGSMELLEASMKAGVAGVSDTLSSVSILTTLLNSYGESAEKVTEYSDKLFTTVRLGKTTLGELSSQLGMVASLANNAGIDFSNVSAAMVAMTKRH